MKRRRGTNLKDGVVSILRAGVHALSVSSSCSSNDLVCRDEHSRAITAFLESPGNSTMQIFGMPGTGKTATVHYALTHLSNSTTGKTTAVFLNGYVIQKSLDIYWTLNVHLSKARLGYTESCPPEQCAANIEKRFRHGWGKTTTPLCVIVVDEVDKVLQKHPKGLFRIIDWLTLPHANCKLITISNSMELAVDAKTKSRLDITRQLVFLPYGVDELRAILLRRVGGIKPKLFSDQAVNLLCHQTASHYGDVRRLLHTASAAICGVLMKVEEGAFGNIPSDGIVSVKDIHIVVRRIFHDRFVEFIKAIRCPILFVVVGAIAKETEEAYKRNESDCRLLVERMFMTTAELQRRYVQPAQKSLSRACYLELLEVLLQVGLIDISSGADRVPLRTADCLFECTDDVFVSLLQPFQTVVDSCRLHDVFGATIGSNIL